MDLSIVTTGKTFGRDDRWIGSAHGLDTAQPGTLDIAAFTTAGYTVTDGVFRKTIVGGTPVALDAGTGLYVPFTAAVDQVLEGYVLTDVSFLRPDGTAADKVGFALLKQGSIVRSHLPFGGDKVDHTTVSTGQFVYVD